MRNNYYDVLKVIVCCINALLFLVRVDMGV
ncbi:hypothetical protein HMPREF1532_00002 [Bacteroides salyersiae WAL 10018 = DSM 18765 = JCM 12988]|jgi:hypothetical protein|nr:hypothetical protein HMPREF1532_00002 [Bacteroides salyersiae WAL 10018 = DSM 18765 = JCM 12988]